MLEVEWFTCVGLCVPSWAPGSWGPEPEGQFFKCHHITLTTVMSPRFRGREVVPMPGHSVPLSALGGLILVFGFLAQNVGKRGSLSHPGAMVVLMTLIMT